MVVAHPDDELFVSGTVCLCVEHGFAATLVCLTDGEGAASGTAVRQREVEASALNLGVKNVAFLHLPDVATPCGPGESRWDKVSLAHQQGAILLELNPELILTHGPGGGYGHAAHIAAHRAVIAAADQTAHAGSVFSFCGRAPRAFFTWHFEGESDVLIDARPFLAKRAASLDCHASQIDFFVQPHFPRSPRKLASAAFGYMFIWTEHGRKRVPIGTARRFFERFPIEGLMLQRAPGERPHFFAEHFNDDRSVALAR